MTSSRWSKVFGLLIFLFAVIFPLLVVFSMYMSLETTTDKMAMNIIGVFLTLGISIGALKLFKRRIKLKKEMGFKISPYYIAFSYGFMSVVSPVLFTWFILTIKDEIEKLGTVMTIICVCEAVAFILKFVQVHFDIKDLAENPV